MQSQNFDRLRFGDLYSPGLDQILELGLTLPASHESTMLDSLSPNLFGRLKRLNFLNVLNKTDVGTWTTSTKVGRHFEASCPRHLRVSRLLLDCVQSVLQPCPH